MINDVNIDIVSNNQTSVNIPDANSMLCDLTSDGTGLLNSNTVENIGTLNAEIDPDIIEQDMSKPYRIIFKGEFVHD